ncbi:MAG TPA: hypothetical protein VMT62_10145 [Syntrophorhabdaceae bacterium]|nr:hypothetical protein [Syntrophorhabdaceae bacterium]
MPHSVSMRNTWVALILAMSIAFPCAGQDTSIIRKSPATGTIVQPAPSAQTPKASQQPQAVQTPAKQGAPILKQQPVTGGAIQQISPAHVAPRTGLLPGAGQPPITAKTCKSNSDCPTWECWDGYCCDRHCMGKCESCGMPGHEGICTPVPDGQDPRRACTIVQGGHPACNTACYSGQCMWPDVGTPCEICAVCDGTGRCTKTPDDDERCGVISCKSMNDGCRTYEDIRTYRCEGFALCKTANLANCTRYTENYSWKDSSGVYRECSSGRIMYCYKDGIHLVWQDGPVIKECANGNVCKTCKPQQP